MNKEHNRHGDLAKPAELQQPGGQQRDKHPLLEALVAAGPAPAPAALVGECIDDEHPTLLGRVKVRWTEPRNQGQAQERWLACLHGVTVRRRDRVLLQLPENWPEPIVSGVVDGFALRPEAARLPGPAVELKADESIKVRSSRGQELLEIFQEESGPVVRLLDPDLDLELPGELRIRADRIELEARRGDVEIKASDDVNVQGEMINLNP